MTCDAPRSSFCVEAIEEAANGPCFAARQLDQSNTGMGRRLCERSVPYEPRIRWILEMFVAINIVHAQPATTYLEEVRG